MKSYALLYPILLAQLQAHPPFASRDEVAIWLRDTWLAIHKEAGASKRRLKILQTARICAEQGWKDVDQQVCYLTSPETPPMRLYVHADGAIVLQQMFSQRNEIIFAKPGRSATSANAPISATDRSR